ncbi:MAG: SMC family ATPase, partial [Bacteroidales bacterium]|nr:SMC family ATPase [Bacteroidales bacterium]
MKIKKLIIRNIASIEKADIDFEKDLIDAGTGLPASMFLISGDTGSGKSVILDGISMALYGTTPRIKTITGQKNNEFRNADGQMVKVYSIDQYTRLGISEKDDCYSEVLFEGNDGLEYCSRFRLGVYLGNTDKGTGERHLKPRTPVLSVTVGTDTFTGEEADKIIKDAVGLSFEQFGRMAMLAQGQFAAFLTGNKKEREDILEQLTNTEHFSRYGEAIKSLFDKAKSVKDDAQIAYVTDKGHTLPEEEVKTLKRQQVEAAKAKQENDVKIKENGRRLDEMKKYETALAAIQTASKRKQDLEQAVKGEDYIAAKALAVDWESTLNERQRLKDRRDAEKDLDEAKTEELDLEKKFLTLDADLAFQRKQADNREEALKEKQSWLEVRKDRAAMYSHAGETLLKIKDYEKVLADMDSLTEKQAKEAGKTQGLVDAKAEMDQLVQKAKKAVEDKQRDIDSLIGQRNALDPEKTNKGLEIVRGEITALNLLVNEMAACAKAKKACGDLRNEVAGDEEKLKALNEKLHNADTAYETAKTARDIARNCYTTMSSSLEDTLVNLRQQLLEENETICPLCGQKIEKITDNFKGRLTELGQQRKEADAFFKKAEETREKALKAQQQFSGALDRKKNDLQVKEQELAKQADGISQKAREAGLETGDSLEERIRARQRELSEKEDGLKETQKKAEELQKHINVLLKEKTPLQKAYEIAHTEASAADQAVKDNATAISNLKDSFDEKEKSKAILFKEITEAIFKFYPEWEEELSATKGRLKTDADGYDKCKESVRSEATELRSLREKLKVIGEFREGISKSYADWAADVQPAEYRCRDIVAEWRELSLSAEALKAAIAGYKKTVSDCDEVLMRWYEITGRDE